MTVKRVRKSLIVTFSGKPFPKRSKPSSAPTGYRCVICGGSTEFTLSSLVKYQASVTTVEKFRFMLPEGGSFPIREYLPSTKTGRCCNKCLGSKRVVAGLPDEGEG